mmetsp:Transcript_31047/g.103410  ORF Transcript_31047/g.103410 Transcript_31047/m.103410 type:complete len:248 (+) Transcript_31047:1180-1923(+)
MFSSGQYLRIDEHVLLPRIHGLQGQVRQRAELCLAVKPGDERHPRLPRACQVRASQGQKALDGIDVGETEQRGGEEPLAIHVGLSETDAVSLVHLEAVRCQLAGGTTAFEAVPSRHVQRPERRRQRLLRNDGILQVAQLASKVPLLLGVLPTVFVAALDPGPMPDEGLNLNQLCRTSWSRRERTPILGRVAVPRDDVLVPVRGPCRQAGRPQPQRSPSRSRRCHRGVAAVSGRWRHGRRRRQGEGAL